MTAGARRPPAARSGGPRPGLARAFSGLAWGYVGFLVVQLFLAGLGVFVSPGYFAMHRTLVHAVGWLDFLLLALAIAGRFPRAVVRRALARGHAVCAVVRGSGAPADVRRALRGDAVGGTPGNGARGPEGADRLTVLSADVMDPAAIAPALRGADAVLSTLGPRGRGPTTVCEHGTASALVAMRAADVTRLVVVSSGTLLRDPASPLLWRVLGRPLLLRRLRDLYADLARMEASVHASDSAWTLVRPVRLTDAGACGAVREVAGDRVVPGAWNVTRAELGAYLVDCVERARHVRATVSVAN